MRKKLIAKFKCLKCKHEYTGPTGPTECPKCGHLYVKWLNYNKLANQEKW